MDWTIKPFNQANHNPVVSVNGQVGVAPITIETTVGQPVTLYASANKDLDGNELNYQWFHYEEAGVVTRALTSYRRVILTVRSARNSSQ